MKTRTLLRYPAGQRGLARRWPAPGNRARGVTLTELLIVLAVVALLAAIAIPSYSAYVVRGKRAEAKTALLQAAQYMERIYSQSGCYSYTDANSCARGAPVPPGLAVTVPTTTATDYAVTFSVDPTVAVPPGQGFTLQAAPTFTDTDCGTLTLDNAGTKGALGQTTATATGATLTAIGQCWNR